MGQKDLGLTAGRETQVKHSKTLAKMINSGWTLEGTVMEEMEDHLSKISLFLPEAGSFLRKGTKQIRF